MIVYLFISLFIVTKFSSASAGKLFRTAFQRKTLVPIWSAKLLILCWWTERFSQISRIPRAKCQSPVYESAVYYMMTNVWIFVRWRSSWRKTQKVRPVRVQVQFSGLSRNRPRHRETQANRVTWQILIHPVLYILQYFSSSILPMYFNFTVLTTSVDNKIVIIGVLYLFFMTWHFRLQIYFVTLR